MFVLCLLKSFYSLFIITCPSFFWNRIIRLYNKFREFGFNDHLTNVIFCNRANILFATNHSSDDHGIPSFIGLSFNINKSEHRVGFKEPNRDLFTLLRSSLSPEYPPPVSTVRYPVLGRSCYCLTYRRSKLHSGDHQNIYSSYLPDPSYKIYNLFMFPFMRCHFLCKEIIGDGPLF